MWGILAKSKLVYLSHCWIYMLIAEREVGRICDHAEEFQVLTWVHEGADEFELLYIISSLSMDLVFNDYC